MTRAIIEGKLDDYHYRVRIPILNKLSSSVGATPSNELAIATIAAIPGCSPKFRNGDIVFIEYEEKDTSKPVIVGRLFNNKDDSIASDGCFDSLIINVNSELPADTSIGDVSATSISYLEGLNTNLQFEIDKNTTEHKDFVNNITSLTAELDVVNSKINEINDEIAEINNKIVQIDTSITNINNNINQIKTQINAINQKNNEQDNQLTNLDNQLTNLDNRLEDVEDTLAGPLILHNVSYGTSSPSNVPNPKEGQIYLYIQ